ncbi:hypothetical protein R3P38DRAFT_2803560 [Favolaschia claudopus]|uniref:Uncharacterized protein n=1 Tax=Favolaschia claudopus TaxID=2862362 RepID=A0AAV9ZSX2_9AGAR
MPPGRERIVEKKQWVKEKEIPWEERPFGESTQFLAKLIKTLPALTPKRRVGAFDVEKERHKVFAKHCQESQVRVFGVILNLLAMALISAFELLGFESRRWWRLGGGTGNYSKETETPGIGIRWLVSANRINGFESVAQGSNNTSRRIEPMDSMSDMKAVVKAFQNSSRSSFDVGRSGHVTLRHSLLLSTTFLTWRFPQHLDIAELPSLLPARSEFKISYATALNQT